MARFNAQHKEFHNRAANRNSIFYLIAAPVPYRRFEQKVFPRVTAQSHESSTILLRLGARWRRGRCFIFCYGEIGNMFFLWKSLVVHFPLLIYGLTRSFCLSSDFRQIYYRFYLRLCLRFMHKVVFMYFMYCYDCGWCVRICWIMEIKTHVYCVVLRRILAFYLTSC